MVKNAEEARELVKKSENKYSSIFPRKKVVDATVEDILKEVEYECRRMRTYAEYDVNVFKPKFERKCDLPILVELEDKDTITVEEFEEIVSRLKDLGFRCVDERTSQSGNWTICVSWIEDKI